MWRVFQNVAEWRVRQSVALFGESGECGGVRRSVASVAECGECGTFLRSVVSAAECGECGIFCGVWRVCRIVA